MCVQRPAFSKDDLLPMDLGTFYREFQNPPQLASLSLHISSQSMADDLVTAPNQVLCSVTEECVALIWICVCVCVQDSLPQKLVIYEKNIDEFDAFVDTLQ